MAPRMKVDTAIPEIYNGLVAVSETLHAAGLPRGLIHLIELRVSQINLCSFCVDMHTAGAKRDGETPERLAALASWIASDLFTAAERAVFAWAEALTNRDHCALAPLHAELTRHFDAEAVATITMAVAVINAWNRVGIASHAGSHTQVK